MVGSAGTENGQIAARQLPTANIFTLYKPPLPDTVPGIMSKYALSAYLLLTGVTLLIATQIPPWVVGAVALFAGLTLAGDALKSK